MGPYCIQKAFLKNFQNAAGKFFFVGLGRFLLRVHPAHIQKQFMSSCSTNPQGPAQPGNMEILITDKPRELRQSKTPEKLCQRRVADYVLYDGRNKMYSIVGELKSVESEAESQNVEHDWLVPQEAASHAWLYMQSKSNPTKNTTPPAG